MNGLFDGPRGERMRQTVFVIGVLAAAFLAVEVMAGVQNLRYIGAGVQPANTISVSGYGEAFGAPDIATFSFTVSSLQSTVAAAQTEATGKINAATDYLKSQGIADKDIRTTDYSVYPQYEYRNASCPVYSVGAVSYCPPGKQVLKGYEVRQTTTVKVRDTAKAGDLLAGVGSKGATEVSGLTFTFDDPNKLEHEAREKAIADAKQQADLLAKQLGVRIVRVVSFSENGGGYPVPMGYRADAALGSSEGKATAPAISLGENKVHSSVSVTYEIR